MRSWYLSHVHKQTPLYSLDNVSRGRAGVTVLNAGFSLHLTCNRYANSDGSVKSVQLCDLAQTIVFLTVRYVPNSLALACFVSQN